MQENCTKRVAIKQMVMLVDETLINLMKRKKLSNRGKNTCERKSLKNPMPD